MTGHRVRPVVAHRPRQRPQIEYCTTCDTMPRAGRHWHRVREHARAAANGRQVRRAAGAPRPGQTRRRRRPPRTCRSGRSTRPVSRGGSRSTCSPSDGSEVVFWIVDPLVGHPDPGRACRAAVGIQRDRRQLGDVAGLRQGAAVRLRAWPRSAAQRQRQRRRPARPAGPAPRSVQGRRRRALRVRREIRPRTCTSRSTPSSATPTGCTGSTTST